MRQFLILTKSIFLNSFRSEGKSKINGSSIISMLFGSGIFAIIFALMTAFVAPIFIQLGLAAEFLTLIIIASQTLILFMGTIILINVLFFAKDAELLLSLPVKSHHIFFAKIAYVYVSELMFSALLVITSGVVLGIVGGFGIAYYLLLLVAVLFVPILPIMLSAIVSIPTMYVISFLKGKPLLSTLVFFVMFGGFMVVYLGFFGSFGSSDPNIPQESINNLALTFKNLYPNINLAKIVTLSSENYLLDFLVVFGGTLGLLAVSFLLSILSYKKGMSSQLEEHKDISNKKVEFVQGSAFKAFIIKEFKEIFRNPGLAFNCLVSVIMAPVMIILYGKIFGAQASEMGGEETLEIVLLLLSFFLGLMLIAGINFAAQSSVSREGVNFNMSKTLPAPYLFQMRAKIRVADIITLAGTIATGISIFIIVPSAIVHIILFCGVMLILGNAINYKAALSDAKKPKLDWESVTVALKNSKASLIAMLLSMALAVPYIIGFVFLFLMPQEVLKYVLFAAFYVIFYGIVIVFNYLTRRALKNKVEAYIAAVE